MPDAWHTIVILGEPLDQIVRDVAIGIAIYIGLLLIMTVVLWWFRRCLGQ